MRKVLPALLILFFAVVTVWPCGHDEDDIYQCSGQKYLLIYRHVEDRDRLHVRWFDSLRAAESFGNREKGRVELLRVVKADGVVAPKSVMSAHGNFVRWEIPGDESAMDEVGE